MTAGELQDMLIAKLTRQRGGTARRWRMAIGPVRVRGAGTYAHCNWDVHPSGNIHENAQIERLLDTIRLDYPIVVPD